jgi:hypothetical protein
VRGCCQVLAFELPRMIPVNLLSISYMYNKGLLEGFQLSNRIHFEDVMSVTMSMTVGPAHVPYITPNGFAEDLIWRLRFFPLR